MRTLVVGAVSSALVGVMVPAVAAPAGGDLLPAAQVVELARAAAEESRGDVEEPPADVTTTGDPAVDPTPVGEPDDQAADDGAVPATPVTETDAPATVPAGSGPVIAGATSTVDAGPVQMVFSGAQLVEDLDVVVGPSLAPQAASSDPMEGLPEDSVVLVAPFDVAATGPAGDVSSFPTSFELVEHPDEPDTLEDVVPGVVIDIEVDAAATAALDAGSVRLYTRETSTEPWVEVASYLGADGDVVHGELDHLSQFVVIGTPFVPDERPRVVLDPDNDVANTVGPSGAVTELPFNDALATRVATQMASMCLADVLITRGATPAVVSQETRAGMANAFGPDLTMTLAFDALRGHPWGTEGDGGSKVYSRGSGWPDDALANQVHAQLPAYTGRPSNLFGPGRMPYDDYASLPGAVVHLEALYLDHNFDWEVISNGFGAIADGVFTGAGMHLESVGFDCTDPATGGWPARPSAAELTRWRHLGHQNYLTYGADPVSFSTGNLVEDFTLATLPGLGEQVIDLGLTYNSQDGRDSRTGAGWSFSLGARAQRFDDGSVLVVRSDGASFDFAPDGWGGYVSDPGARSGLAEDGSGGLVWTDEDGGAWAFDTRDVEGIGELTSYTDPSGQTLTLTYGTADGDDQHQPLVAITDAAGQRVDVTSDAVGRIGALTLPDGRTWALAYDGAGDLVAITDAAGGVRSFTYDGSHQMLTATDPVGTTYLQNTFDAAGRVVRQVDGAGKVSTFDYDDTPDEDGLRSVVYTDAAGRAHTYRFDASSRIVSLTDAAGETQSFTYDRGSRVTSRTDAAGRRTAYTYDADGEVEAETAPDGTTTTYDHTGRWLTGVDEESGDGGRRRTGYEVTPAGLVAAVTDAAGGRTVLDRTAAGDVARFVSPAGAVTSNELDARGNVVAVTDPLGRVTRIGYDASNRPVSTTDPAGGVTTFEWDAHDNLVSQTGPDGARSTFTYDANSLLASSTAPDGGVTSYGWDSLFHQTSSTDPLGAVTAYTYDGADNLLSVTDALGATTTLTYDGADRLTSTTDATGSVWTQEYEDGLLVAQVDPLGGRTGYTYDDAGRTVGVTDPTGATWGTGYDRAGRIVSSVDPLGATTTYSYDELDRLVSTTDPAGTSATTYDADGNPTAVTDRLGRVTSTTVDAAGQPVTVTDPSGAVTAFTYDPLGNVTSVTDALGAATSFGYDAAGRTLTETDPTGGTWTTAYDPAGRVLTEVDPLGASQTSGYDLSGNLVTSTGALGGVTAHVYDASGNLASTTDAAGAATAFERDAAGRITTVIDPTGARWESGYDASGRLVVETDPEGHETRYAHDAVGRPTSTTDATGATWGSGYNLAGRLVATVDPLGATTTLTLDESGRTTAVTDPLGAVTSYEYDAESQLLATTDRRGHRTAYGYDEASRVATVTDPTGAVRASTYDAVGNVLTSVDPLGAVTGYTYDPAGRQVSVTDPLGAVSQTEHDPAGRATVRTGPDGATSTIAYDLAGQVLSETDPMGAVTSHSYDAVGNRVSSTDPDGRQTSWTYDAAGRLTTVVDAVDEVEGDGPGADPAGIITGLAGTTPTMPETRATTDTNLTTTYAYSPAGHLVTTTDPRGSTTTVEHDPVGRVLSETDPTGSTWSYGYDAAGQEVTATDALGQVTTTAYDPRGDVVETSYGGGVQGVSFTYDEESNLIAMVDPTGATGWVYDGAGRVTSQIDGAGSTLTYSYDPAGQLVTAGIGEAVVGYSYDLAGQPLRQHTEWGTADYTWDAAGRLSALARTAPDGTAGVESTFAYDAAGRATAISHLTPESSGATVQAGPAAPGPASGRGSGAGARVPATGSAASPTATGAAPTCSADGTDGIVGAYMAGRDAPSTVTCQKTDQYLGDRVLAEIAPVAAGGEGVRFDYTFRAGGDVLSATRTVGAVQAAGVAVADLPDGGVSDVGGLGAASAAVPLASGPSSMGAPAAASALAERRTYVYDRAGRLAGSTSSTGAESSYDYDQAGNRTAWSTTDDPSTIERDATASQTTFDGANRPVLTTTERDGTSTEVAYGYDANGSRTSTKVTGAEVLADEYDSSSTYDQAGRLSSVETQDRSESYVYDGLGRRTVTTTRTALAERETISTWDGYAPVGSSILTSTDSGERADTAVFVRDVLGRTLLENATALEATDSGEVRWALLDALGSSVATASGEVVTELASYSDFGAQGFETAGWAGSAGFTGEVSDPVLGTVSFYSRTYEPVVGGWTSADAWRGTLTEPLTANRYAYVEDNPVTMVDAGGYLAVAPRWMPGIGGLVSKLGSVAKAVRAVVGVRAGLAAARAVPGVSAVSRVASAARAAAQRVAAQSSARSRAKAALASERTRAAALKAEEANKKTARHLQAANRSKRAEPQWAQCMEDPGRQLTAGEAQRLGDEKLRRMVDGLPPCQRWYAHLPGGWTDPPSIPWGSIVRGALGIDDVTGCFIEGRASSCAWVAAGFVPFGLGKVVSGVKGLKAVDRVGDAVDLARPGDELVNLAGEHRTLHIVEGHVPPGLAGKTLFPEGWSIDKVMGHVSDIATDPSLTWVQQTGPLGASLTNSGQPVRYYVVGIREGVRIRVVVEPGGEGIITAFPVP